MKLFWTLLLPLCLLSPHFVHANHQPTVLASIHPLALVAASVVPVERLEVLLPDGMTPHDFSLRPSDIDRIQNADIIFWAGAESEPYLAGFVKRWPDKHWLDVSRFAPEVKNQDPHWWFSPTIMQQAQAELAQLLHQDAISFAVTVDAAMIVAKSQLAPVKAQGFWVFHQAYDHWVQALELNQLGAFTVSPEHKPGARTISTMRQQLKNGEVHCVFSEPEFSPSLVESVTQGFAINRGELDPMAYHIPLSADGYVQFLLDLSDRFAQCLAPFAPH